MRVISRLGALAVQYGARLLVIAVGGLLISWAAFGDQPATVLVVLIPVGVTLVVLGAFVERIDEVSGATFRLRFRSADVGALGPAVDQARKDQLDPETIDLPGDDAWDGARYRLGERAIEWLLTDLGGYLSDCEARVFLYDDDKKMLMPAFRPTSAPKPPFGWKPGQGVTGLAYKSGEYVYAEEPHTHDGTYGLTPEMQRRFKDLTAVAAVPLVNRRGAVIGTLSLSSRKRNTQLTTAAGLDEHVALAEQVSVTLVDLLRLTA